MIQIVLFSTTFHFPVLGGGSGVVGAGVVEVGAVVVGAGVVVVVEVVVVEVVVVEVVVVVVVFGAIVVVGITIDTFDFTVELLITCALASEFTVVVFNFWSAFNSTGTLGVTPLAVHNQNHIHMITFL